MQFCPTCNNMLDISKNPPKRAARNFLTDTPNTVSAKDDSDADSESDNESDVEENNEMDVESIIDKFLEGEIITPELLGTISVTDIISHPKYKEFDRTARKEFDEQILQITKEIDSSVSAYYACNTCMYSKLIAPGTLIMSKASEGITSGYVNYERYRNQVYNKVVSSYRGYICPNAKCVSHKDHSKREAVFYRKPGSIETWMTCKACRTYFKQE